MQMHTAVIETVFTLNQLELSNLLVTYTQADRYYKILGKSHSVFDVTILNLGKFMIQFYSVVYTEL